MERFFTNVQNDRTSADRRPVYRAKPFRPVERIAWGNERPALKPLLTSGL